MPRKTQVMSGISDSSALLSTARSIATDVTTITSPRTAAVCAFDQRRKPYRKVRVIQIQWNGTVCHCGNASIATAQPTQNAPHASSPRRSGVDHIAQVPHGLDDGATKLVA